MDAVGGCGRCGGAVVVEWWVLCWLMLGVVVMGVGWLWMWWAVDVVGCGVLVGVVVCGCCVSAPKDNVEGTPGFEPGTC